jgi:hypothetical protein
MSGLENWAFSSSPMIRKLPEEEGMNTVEEVRWCSINWKTYQART